MFGKDFQIFTSGPVMDQLKVLNHCKFLFVKKIPKKQQSSKIISKHELSSLLCNEVLTFNFKVIILLVMILLYFLR